MSSLTVIVLTYNEEVHIRRCLDSAFRVGREVIVVDSGSQDSTTEIAEKMGARVLSRAWVNHATQINWVLDAGGISTDWVMRLDADEYIEEGLEQEIEHSIAHASQDITGFELKRYVVFQGKRIRHGGGVSPGRVLRLWRHGKAQCEQRWMDEHMMLLEGRSELARAVLIDDNLKTLTWWIDKHNHYANREALEVLNQKYGFLESMNGSYGLVRATGTKRWLKNKIYLRLPGGLRAILYFLYRAVFRLGILDGLQGMAFHFLQGFWYRLIVDMKVEETERYRCLHNVEMTTAVQEVLGVDISNAVRNGIKSPAATNAEE